MTTIDKTRGENLAVTVTIQNGGSNVYADVSNGYSIEAKMGSVKGGDEIYDLGASFSNGSGVINYETANVIAGTYYFDVKLGFPTGEERWTETLGVRIIEPNTKP